MGTRSKSKGAAERSRIGEAVLMSYLVLVVAIALLRDSTGWPTIAQLASTPALLAHGEWWRLATSAFVVNGPPLPQVLAIAVLGSLAIYLGGSWLFWTSAVAGHVVGTLVAYIGFSAAWLSGNAVGLGFLTNPDYGVSLVWCAALGAFAGLAWLGTRRRWVKPEHPYWAVAAGVVMVVVTVYSDDMAAVQHVVAFIVGLAVLALVSRTRPLALAH
jgi:membrane associated rhomboid family serine protease